ncbi:serine/threonine-protein kinase ksp1 [Pseudomassariella vexata]|uniref:Serine/threonine-protein kinase ksp1 n=1 Tax=Pseudomassariella vexata TaxID=1141098 RepID=A0A1Y2DW39_9PEZI|nr:serine/threonine-protein kinase ksp1 [Pseudomassariella vexata]ORY63512.1 serine/threonine-protein kinase ksp1 [Pseudomassariella vexata]
MECLRNNFQDGVVLGGRFQTISPLNHGSFGMVFMARDLQTNDIVAVKCLTKKAAANDLGIDFAVDDQSEELFCHRVLGAHPNIVSLIDTFETDAHVYLALEFCSRGDLYEAIRTGYGPLETEHVRRFMLELVDAVSYMHSKGIYHRDIKPENIFLTENGSMKLGDFGLATTDKWSYESTVGSDRYMAPEQYDSAGAGYSPIQADIWAIGICLLNILFSRNPFTTPTEADPLFLDFSRDKQSLFDVFPTMSQDTYEVIVECMNLDPTKRSLVGVKNALRRVVSFTTLEEEDDDFCCGDRPSIATANREPLRTPSIQSPQLEQGSFPWAKALHATSPRPIRQLSAIPDDESYTEDLFPKSEGTVDWMSSAQTPSISSVLTSSLGASINSLTAGRHMNMPMRTAPRVSPMAGSLPITMSRTKPNLSAMSVVFGRPKEAVSKSWSDMWEEDEEDEAELDRQIQALKELNARSWSQDSKREATPTLQNSVPVAQAPTLGHQKSAASPVRDTFNDIDGDLVADGFFFQHEPTPVKQTDQFSSRYSPASKHNAVDKWAALGERRRAVAGSSETERSPDNSKFRRQFGLGFAAAPATGIGIMDHATHNHNHNKWNWNLNKERTTVGDCPWTKGRDWNWRKEKRHDFGDVEWVGNWQAAH